MGKPQRDYLQTSFVEQQLVGIVLYLTGSGKGQTNTVVYLIAIDLITFWGSKWSSGRGIRKSI